MSELEMLSRMGPVGWTVTILLLLLSVQACAVTLGKLRQFGRRISDDREFTTAFTKVRKFSELQPLLARTRGQGVRTVAEAAAVEEESLPDGPLDTHGSQAVREAVEAALEDERAVLETGLSQLVVVAGTAPFLGLFGTVWGILHSFAEIARLASADLAVVAPGIAEALITTIVGLGVAMPAAAAHQVLQARLRKIESADIAFAGRLLALFERTRASRA